MKNQMLLLLLSAMFLILIVGCVNVIENDEQKIIVYKNSDANKYEEYREITNNNQVQEVKKILNSIEWKKAKVQMERPADYQFFFHYKNKNIETDTIQHLIWISPKKDRLEAVRGNDEYARLTNKQSELLFEIITEEKLGSLK